MPTQEYQVSETIVRTIWHGPLKEHEIEDCFAALADTVSNADGTLHLLFNIANAGNIALQAPTLFLRSRIFALPNLGKIAVFGVNPTGQILGRIAATMTGTEIAFFDDEADALAYLNQ